MERVLILDTETTGLDPAKDRAIEVAAVLYSVRHATTVLSTSSLIRSPENPAEHINRIPASALTDAPDPEMVWPAIEDLGRIADAVVAHRAEFDRQFVTPALRDRPWICSKFDVEWPRQTRPGSSLVPLALEHGLGVAYAHRAMADCDLIARLLTRSAELGADVEQMLLRAMRPKAAYVAEVSYEERQMAKDAGFQWDAASKKWRRTMFVEDVGALPFETSREG